MTSGDIELSARIFRAESDRFAHPLLLIHGLWTGSWLWGRMAGFLGHRGWESWAVDLPGRGRSGAGERSVDLVMERCVRIAGRMRERPILVGHDAGAVIALHLMGAVTPPAVVLLAPTLPGYGAMGRVLGGIRRIAGAILGRRIAPPSGRAAAVLFAGADAPATEMLRARLVEEEGRFVYQLLRGGMPGRAAPPRPPVLIVGGADDVIAPPDVVRAAAGDLGASSLVLPGGHWLPLEENWRETTGRVHRWIVQTLGDPLLLYRDDVENGEAP
jgi:non-heme chloroperoxidase